MPGETQRMYVDDDGNMFGRQEVSFYYEGDEVAEIAQTKVFEIADFQPLSSYTDEYVIGKFYELSPDDNGMTKDFDRERAVKLNTVQMRKLWEYLQQNKVVARGEFNAASRGFMASDGYIRAVQFGNKWGLEIGVFKEAKVFRHLQEDVPTKEDVENIQTSGKKKVLKRI